MRDRWFSWALVFALSICLSIGLSRVMAMDGNSAVATEYDWNLPQWTPEPVVPETNPMSTAKVELGRHLFYDRALSITGEYSCATCHKQSLAFTDGRRVAIGAKDDLHPRNTMSLTNIAYNPVLTWANPLITRLESQALIPIFGEHPLEMGMVGREREIIERLQNDPEYSQMFAKAFSAENPVNIDNLTKALASFQRTLLSFNSAYDRYRYEGKSDAISAAAKEVKNFLIASVWNAFTVTAGLISATR